MLKVVTNEITLSGSTSLFSNLGKISLFFVLSYFFFFLFIFFNNFQASDVKSSRNYPDLILKVILFSILVSRFSFVKD